MFNRRLGRYSPEVLEHLLYSVADLAIAREHHVSVLARGMHVALRHGTHGSGELFEDALARSSALAHVALDAAREAYLFAQIDKDLGRSTARISSQYKANRPSITTNARASRRSVRPVREWVLKS